MIWILLSKKIEQVVRTKPKQNINRQIIEWTRNNIQKENLDYRLLFVNEYLFESEISEIKDDDYVFWNPYIASKNLALVQEFKNSIVILEHQTYINEKISHVNPINENTAINYGFSVMYLNEQELSTSEWKLAVQDSMYLIHQEQVLQALKNNPNNYKQIQVERQDVFDDLANSVRELIDL